MRLSEIISRCRTRLVGSILGIVSSSVLLGVFLIMSFVFLFISFFNAPLFLLGFFFSFILMILSSVGLGFSISGCNRAKKGITLFELLQKSSFRQCSFEELSTAWNMFPKYVLKYLKKMIQKHPTDFSDVLIDYQNKKIYADAAAVAPTLDTSAAGAPQNTEQNGTMNTAEQEALPVLNSLSNQLNQVLSVEDAAPIQVLIEDIRHLLNESHKEGRDVADITQFLHRFLPMAEKLVSRLPLLPPDRKENESTKLQILEALGTLHLAFVKKTEQLMQHDVMQVDAEAAVLEQLLRQDGLLDTSDFPVMEIPQDETQNG